MTPDISPDLNPEWMPADRSPALRRAHAGARADRPGQGGRSRDREAIPEAASTASPRSIDMTGEDLARVVIQDALAARQGDTLNVDLAGWRRRLAGGPAPAVTAAAFDRVWSAARPFFCELLREVRGRYPGSLQVRLTATATQANRRRQHVGGRS